MKNLALVLSIVLSKIAYGQIPNVGYEFRYGPNHDAVEVAGIGYVEVGGRYQATAINRDYPAFEEVVQALQSILDSNKVVWEDYSSMEIETDGIGTDSLEALHMNIATGGYLEAEWEISRTDNIVITASIFLYSTGYRLEVKPKYL